MPNKSTSKKNSNAGLIIVGVIGGLLLLGSVVMVYEYSTKKPTTSTNGQAEPQTQSSSASTLAATVKKVSDVPGIEVTNSENVAWDSCELKLNGEYKRTLSSPLQPNSPLNNPYGLFTRSDGKRFDYSTTTPKNLYIACKVNGASRNNIFNF